MKSLRYAAAAAVAALCAQSASGQAPAVELLVNPGAELGVSGWTDPLGHGFQSVHSSALSYVGVTQGSHAFWAGDTGPTGPYDHELYQEVDVTPFAVEIDAGGIYWHVAAHVYSRDFGGVQSTGHVAVELFDAARVLLDSYTTPDPNGYGAYIPRKFTKEVPAGTRSLRFRMLASRTGGDVTDALFDAQSLQLFFEPEVYCTAKVNSLGCTPTIGSGGWPDALQITATGVRNNKNGIFFWGRASKAAPFYGGTLCVQAPVVRTPVQDSGGSPTGDDCTGTYSFDFTAAYASSKAQPGDTAYAQFWSRDPGFPPPLSVGLTDAIQWTVSY